MITNVNDFILDIKKFSNALDISIGKAIKTVITELFLMIVKGTPIDQGTARISWFMGINEVDDSVYNVPEEGDKYTNAEIERQIKKQLRKIRRQKDLFTNVYIYNNIVYIRRLEYDGHSQQAKNGWVRLSVASIRNRVKDIIRKSTNEVR